MRLALATALAFAVAAVPAAAKPVTETDSLESIRAELSYVTHKNKTPTDIQLRVFDGVEQIVDESVSDDMFFSPAYLFVDKKSVHVVDLDGDGVGEAIFDLYTGGAHCCLDTYVYQRSTKIDLFTGNAGYKLKDYDGDGFPEIDSTDDAFSSAYSSYAGSLRPIRVLQLNDGKFENFTRDPSVAPTINKQIKHFKRLLRKYRKKAKQDPILTEIVRSALAGITANECSLGDCDKGYALFDAEIERGTVTKSFKRQVVKDLKNLGYDS
jgi:hypothetical protein